MRLHHLRLRGITEAFPNEVCVDFDSLGEGLIAIVGENGAGKSTLIGSVFAALFRQLPGQKRSLYDFATHPQPEIDLTFSVNGARYRSLLKIDPKSRQMESYLFNGDGKPLTNGKREPFEELVRKCAGTPEFFLSSIFSSQKRTGNFLSLDRSERKELFIRELLGLDRLRLIAAAAKDKAEDVARTTLGLEGQARSLKELVEGGVEEPGEVEARLREVSSRLETLEAEKRAAQQRLLELQAAEASRKPLLGEVETLKQRLRKTDAEITETKRQIGRDESLLTGKKDLADLTGRGAVLTARIEELHRQIREIQGLETSNRETERTVQTLDAELRANLAELERLRVEREELAIVPCRGEGVYASCPKIQRAVEAGQKIPILEGEVATLSIEVEVQRSSLIQIVTPSFDLTRTLEGCERDRKKVDQERQRYEELRAVEARRDERLKALERMAQARAEVSEELSRKESGLSAFSDLDAKIHTSRREIENADRLIVSCRRERDGLIARQAQIIQRQEQREAARTRLAQVEAELGAARTEQEDYNYLARVFGPDEIQLCEIQAAGPQVSILVNSLLEGCFDNKFEIRFRTQRPKADGKGMVDDFDVEVRNKNLDRTYLVDELSGGQFVLVNEAVNLGIAIYNMRQGEGIRYETLFRDETVGALDATNGKEYVRMLRRAMDLGGFHQVIFICHTPLVWELADRVVEIKDGRVAVMSGVEGLSWPASAPQR
ncbi:MAG: AAA family ATPase [Terriglobia bacterium]|jgi:exonuclease SbcC